MLSSKESLQIQIILEHLAKNEMSTIKELSEIVSLSEKTVRKRLDILENFLEEKRIGTIHRKPRIGVWLEINKEKRVEFNTIMSEDLKTTVNPIINNLTMSLVGIFLKNPNSVKTLETLSQELFMSVPSISKKLDEVQKWFNQYGIKLERQTNRGHWLVFDEKNYRIAFHDFIIQNFPRKELYVALESYLPGVNVRGIVNLIKQTEKDWNIDLNDKSFVTILILTSLLVKRSAMEAELVYSYPEELQEYSEYGFVYKIIDRVSQKAKIINKKDESSFIAIEIISNSSLNHLNNGQVLKKEEEHLKRVIERMVKMTSDILSVDLTDDLTLKESLFFHLRAALFRMKHGYSKPNLYFDQIRRYYPRTFRAVWPTSIILEEEYNIQVNENELAYLCLYFQSALERRSSNLKILVVTSLSNAQNQLIIEKLQRYIFGENAMDIMSYHAFSQGQVRNYDLVITTEELDIQKDYDNIIRVSPLISEEEISYLQDYLQQYFSKRYKENEDTHPMCNILFEPDLIFIENDPICKEEVLSKLIFALEQKGYVDPSFKKSVIDRENKMHTGIGNGIAIPHGDPKKVNQGKVAVMILKKPVRWSYEETVSVVFLLAMTMKTKEEEKITKMFYKQYINLFSHDQVVNKIMSLDSNLAIYKYLTV